MQIRALPIALFTAFILLPPSSLVTSLAVFQSKSGVTVTLLTVCVLLPPSSLVTSLDIFQSKRGSLTSLHLLDSDKLLVGGRNSLYQFDSRGNLSTGSLEFELDTRCMNQTCDTANITDNDVSILRQFTPSAISPTYVLFCGTSAGQRCYVIKHDTTTESFEVEGETVGSNSSAVIVKHGTYNMLYSAVNDAPADKPTISIKYIRYYKHVYQIHNNSRTFIKATEGQTIDFVYGFEGKGYVYMLHNNRTRFTTAYMSQMCSNDPDFSSYVEARIACGEYDILESAYMYNHTSATRGAILLTTFSSSRGHGGSALCAFDVSELAGWFRRAKEKCYREAAGSWPEWMANTDQATDGHACTTRDDATYIYCKRSNNTRIRASDDFMKTPILVDAKAVMTSSVLTSINDTLVAYIGHRKGVVKKVLFDESFSQSLTLFSVDTGDGQPIRRGMLLDEPRNKLYFTYGDKVGMLGTDNCSLHVDCVGCLSDRGAACNWLTDADGLTPGRCVHRHSWGTEVAAGNMSVFTDHCLPPVIDLVRPLTGPTQGGTPLTISGQFDHLPLDHDRLHVSLEDRNTCNISNVTRDSIVCVTSPVTMVTLSATVFLTVDAPDDVGNRTGQLVVQVNGSVEYREAFVYKTPSVNVSVGAIYSRRSGEVRLHIHGASLDIGVVRAIDVGNKPCAITPKDEVSSGALSCRAPAMAAADRLSSRITIDGAVVQGPDITYVDDPTLHELSPNRVTKSGGVHLSFQGARLRGLGTDKLFLTFQDNHGGFLNSTPGECFVVNDVLECTSGAVTLSPTAHQLPMECSVVVQNFYKDAVLLRTNGTLENSSLSLAIVSDPELSPLQSNFYIGATDKEELTLKGRNLLNVVQAEIKIHVGSELCVLITVAEDTIKCGFNVTEQISSGKSLPVTVTIGHRNYALGHAAAAQKQPLTETSTIAEASSGFLAFGLALAGIVLVLVFAISSLVAYQKRKKRLRGRYTTASYRADFVTLDGLSESNNAESEQNQRNVYQPMQATQSRQDQTAAKQVGDDDDDDASRPLLLDDNTRLLLDRQKLLINRNCLVMGEVIGQGNFGCVYKCFYTVPGEKEERIVAAKTLHRPDPKDADVQQFVDEALLMKDFHHVNVMELVGICPDLDRTPLVVLPYMRTGDLLTYIKDAKNSPKVYDLVQFGVDIANGMLYLSQLKFVHRDLAARNCMLDDDLRVKIADFGLSRDVYEKEYYSSCDKNAKLPIKWMSPESLEKRTYTSKSDVWSYAIVLWELLTRGMVPYPTVDNWDILRYLKDGRRMVKPDHCPGNVYTIMLRCWSWAPEDRPSFGDLTIEMPQILHNNPK